VSNMTGSHAIDVENDGQLMKVPVPTQLFGRRLWSWHLVLALVAETEVAQVEKYRNVRLDSQPFAK